MTVEKNFVISDEELEKCYEESKKAIEEIKQNNRSFNIPDFIKTFDLSKGKDPYNAYNYYMLNCLATQPTYVGGVHERHHVVPKHAGGPNNQSNLCVLTVKQHVIAHYLRFKIYGEIGDKLAYLWRNKDVEEVYKLRQEIIKQARENDRKNSLGFFNPEFQRTMGQRGGLVGGARNTEAQTAARQRVGLEYGRQGGMENASDVLKEFKTKYSIWGFSQNVKNNRANSALGRADEIFFLVTPKAAYADKIRTLQRFVPNSITGKISTMNKLATNPTVTKQLNGWRIICTLTRSEIGAGLAEFNTQFPNNTLVFDENFDVSLLMESIVEFD